MQRRKIGKLGKNLLLAYAAILTYNIVAGLIVEIGCVVFSEETIYAHYFMTDSIVTVTLMLVYTPWVARICRREKMSFVAGKVFNQPYLMMSIPVIILGVYGISDLWLNFADKYLRSVPLFSNSMNSFVQAWSKLGDEAYIWGFLAVVLVGPIVEELLFRGIVFHYLEKVKSGWFAIIVSGIAFGLWHQEPVQVVYAAIIGVLYGMIYFKVRDLRVTIILHVANNFLSTLPPAIDTPTVQNIIQRVSYIMLLPALVILVQIYMQKGTKTQVE